MKFTDQWDNPAPITYNQVQAMVAQMKRNNSGELTRIKGNPFIRRIQEVPIPKHNKLPLFDIYDSTIDPQNHLCHVNSLLDLYFLNNDLRC